MANAWFRLYSEFATDPKVQMLSEAMQRRFVMCLCIRCCNGDVTLQDEEMAFQLRISNDEWAETKRVLVSKNLITEDNQPTAWDKRQFRSDSSAERVSKYREKKKSVCNVTVTPPDTDSDTDSDTERTKKQRAPRFDAQAHLSSLGVCEGVARDWLAQRKTLKAAATETAIAGIQSEAMKAGVTLERALAECCSRGWRGFKAEWLKSGQARGSPSIHDIPPASAFSGPAVTDGQGRPIAVPKITEADMEGLR